MTFDSIVHVTSDGSWLGGNRYDASESRLMAELDAGNVERACLIAIAGYASNEDMEATWQRYPERFVPVGSINPALAGSETEVRREVRRLAERGFRGLKLHPRLSGFDPLSPLAIAAMQAAGEHRLVVFLDTLFRGSGDSVAHPSDIIDQLAAECTETQILLLHGGGPVILEVYDIVCRRPNLTLDLSATMMRYRGSSIDFDLRFLCQRFDQRMTVGSDFPEWTPTEARNRLQELFDGVPDDKKERILRHNLTTLFAQQEQTDG